VGGCQQYLCVRWRFGYGLMIAIAFHFFLLFIPGCILELAYYGKKGILSW